MGCSCRTFASVTTGSTAVSGDWVIVGVVALSVSCGWTRRSRSWSSCSRNLIVRSQWSTSIFCSSIFFWIIFKISLLFIRDRGEAEFDYRTCLTFHKQQSEDQHTATFALSCIYWSDRWRGEDHWYLTSVLLYWHWLGRSRDRNWGKERSRNLERSGSSPRHFPIHWREQLSPTAWSVTYH